jgi:hypothetical protein
VSAAGITRFGDQIERRAAASFRCARCGEVAGIVRGRVGLIPGSRYLSESVNSAHASAGTLSVKLSRLVVSRTRTMPLSLAVSTQDPPLPPE